MLYTFPMTLVEQPAVRGVIKSPKTSFKDTISTIRNRFTIPHNTPDGKPLPFTIRVSNGKGELVQVDSLTRNK